MDRSKIPHSHHSPFIDQFVETTRFGNSIGVIDQFVEVDQFVEATRFGNSDQFVGTTRFENSIEVEN